MLQDQWFIAKTNPQREIFVLERLRDMEPYLPRFKNPKGRIAPVFPGYLFIPKLRSWGVICTTIGVRGLLMSGDNPSCVSGMEIAKWRSRERGGLVQLPPPPRFRPGDRLTITRGTLRQRTVIHSGMAGKDRERVLIDMLGQNVTLIVPSTDLVPENRRPTRNGLRFQRENIKAEPVGRFQDHRI